jgi:hypothetical protein
MSTYNNLIPQPSDKLSVSQGDLLSNFGTLSNAIDNDHVDILDPTATEQMKHKYIRLKEQTAPVAATTADEGGLYVDDSDHALYFKPHNDGTAEKISSGGSGGGNVLAWGLMTYQGSPNFNYTINYGSNLANTVSVITPSLIQVNFTTALASANYIVLISKSSVSTANTFFVAGSQTVNSFQISGTATNIAITVIGV